MQGIVMNNNKKEFTKNANWNLCERFQVQVLKLDWQKFAKKVFTKNEYMV